MGATIHRSGKFQGLVMWAGVLLVLVSLGFLSWKVLAPRGTQQSAPGEGMISVLPLPAFEMTRNVTLYSEGGVVRETNVYHLSYEREDEWTETLLSSSSAPDRAGDFQRLSRRQVTHSEEGQEVEGPAGTRGRFIPGPWMFRLEDLARRAEAGGQPYSISVEGDTTTVQVQSKIDISEYVYDTKSGIPLEYRIIIDGQVLHECRAVAVTVGDRVVR